MKEAIITDLNGLYTDVALVADAESGVTPLYEQPALDPEAEAPVPTLIGYRVAVPVTPGLYRPRFELAAWDDYAEAERQAYDAYLEGPLAEWLRDEDEERGDMPVYVPPELPAYWLEGLTAEEIAALHPPAQETDSEKLARLEQENMLLKAQIVASTDRQDFMEDVIAEVLMQVYQ